MKREVLWVGEEAAARAKSLIGETFHVGCRHAKLVETTLFTLTIEYMPWKPPVSTRCMRCMSRAMFGFAVGMIWFSRGQWTAISLSWSFVILVVMVIYEYTYKKHDDYQRALAQQG